MKDKIEKLSISGSYRNSREVSIGESSFTETDLRTELKNKGVGTDWVDSYVNKFGKK